MSRKHRKSMADRPVTRRYVARVVERARQDIIRAIVANPPVVLDMSDVLPPEAMDAAAIDRRLAGLPIFDHESRAMDGRS